MGLSGCAKPPQRGRVRAAGLLKLAALAALAAGGGCRDDSAAPVQTELAPATADAAEIGAAEQPPQSEATLARAYVAAWQRCLLVTRGRTEQAWARYELSFKPTDGRPRSKEIEPYIHRLDGSLARCAMPAGASEAVVAEITPAGDDYIKATQGLAATIAEVDEALRAEGAREGGYTAIADLGPRFGTEYAAWTLAAGELAAALDPVRERVDEVWLAEVEREHGKNLAWLVGRVAQAGRGLAPCLGAAPGTEPCRAALESFDAATGEFEAHCSAHPEAPLGAFWLDVFRAKLAPAKEAATAIHTTKTNARKQGAVTTELTQTLAQAMADLALAGDRVRFDFP